MNLEVHRVGIFSNIQMFICILYIHTYVFTANINLKVLLIPISDVRRTVSENEFPEKVSLLMTVLSNLEAFSFLYSTLIFEFKY